MKPTKNRVFCPECGRAKMLFQTEKKAEGFIRFNGDDIPIPEGCTLRTYYCMACGGWHITHKRYRPNYGQFTENVIEQYREMMRLRTYDKERRRQQRELSLMAKAERMAS